MAACVLQNSKLKILQTVDFFIKYLDTSGITLAYCDTDSYMLCLTDKLDDLVKKDLKAEWESKKGSVFVLDESDVDQLRTPGLLKIEAESQNASFIAMSSKLGLELSF